MNPSHTQMIVHRLQSDLRSDLPYRHKIHFNPVRISQKLAVSHPGPSGHATAL